MDMYAFIKRSRELYSLLQDEKSRDVFWTRMQYDLKPDESVLQKMLAQYSEASRKYAKANPSALIRQHGRKMLSILPERKEKIILYGTGETGYLTAQLLSSSGLDFYAYSGRRAADFKGQLHHGKPVVTPDWLFEHADEVFVVIAAGNQHNSADEIMEFLKMNEFPEDHILNPYEDSHLDATVDIDQYFEFPELYQTGTAFMDCGCYDGWTTIWFSRWCAGRYSKVFAFEPDPTAYKRCRYNLERADIHDLELINAGLSDTNGTSPFSVGATPGSRILSEAEAQGSFHTIRTVKIDSVVGEDKIGFIKMDIEGAEYSALHGAERTIRRDRPLLAICVYHLPGDLLAIMDYCSQIVPEYRFWLRQYPEAPNETVLYASCNVLAKE